MLKIYRLNKKQNTFEVTLKYKGVGVHVSFVDGNTYNGTPARCHTSDVFKQRAIEASQMFKDKEITLERCVENESDRKREAAKAAAKPQMRSAIVSNTRKPVKPVVPEPEPTPAPETVKPVVPEPEPAPAPEPVKDETKEFANLGEAILYIAQTWQMEAKTEKEARDILKAHGINPKIKKG